MLGCVLGHLGEVFGQVWEGFWKKFAEVQKSRFSKVYGSNFPASGCSTHFFKPIPGPKIPQIRNPMLSLFVCYFLYIMVGVTLG